MTAQRLAALIATLPDHTEIAIGSWRRPTWRREIEAIQLPPEEGGEALLLINPFPPAPAVPAAGTAPLSGDSPLLLGAPGGTPKARARARSAPASNE